MDYRFNYQFLGQFLTLNGFDKSVIMQCIKTKDYGTMNRYRDGETSPSVEQILRISNQFQIPLSAWFFNIDHDRDIHIGAPLDESYTTPLHGFSEGNSKGGPKQLSPDTNKRTASIIPKMASEKTDISAILGTSTEKCSNTGAENIPDTSDLQQQISDLHISHEKEIDRIKALHERDLSNEKKHHKKALKEASDRHAAERLQLIDIIKSQQETINRLSREITHGTQYCEPEMQVQMAAENPHPCPPKEGSL